jgi:hypothetical protein
MRMDSSKRGPNEAPILSHRCKTKTGYMATSSVCLSPVAPKSWGRGSAMTFSLRKEVIQPQVLLRLPCYDFTPIMSHTLDGCPPCGLANRLLVQPTFVM